MSRGSLTLVAVALALAVRPGLAGQQARDSARPSTATASVTGTVVTGEAAPRPVSRAVVTIASGSAVVPQSVATDEAGRFVFRDLPPGTYYVVAAKPGYVETAYGAKHVGLEPGVPLAVVAGQVLSGLTIDLPHGAVLTGTIRYATGRPAVSASVKILRIDLVDGRRQANPDVTTVTADDRGVYRAFGLGAGSYLIQSQGQLDASVGTSEVQPPQVSAAEVRWAQQAVASGPAPAGATPAPPSTRPTALAPVYYPGTSDPVSATLVTVGVAEERTGLDFIIAPVPTATVSGRVIGVDGAPATSGTLTLSRIVPAEGDLTGPRIGAPPSGFVLRDGSFRLGNIAPGHYRLTVRSMPPSPTGQFVAAPQPALFPGGPDGATLWAQEEVAVDGQDVDDLALRLQPALAIAGKVVFETTTKPDFNQVRVVLGTAVRGNTPADLVARMMGAASSGINADGTFSIGGLTPDRYRLAAMTGGLRSLIALVQPGLLEPTPETIFLKSALWHGQDLVDTPLDLKAGGSVADVVITFTDQPSVLSGTVRDSAGRPTPAFPIVVFATDRAAWYVGSRRVVQARVASDGQFTVTALPAGEYYIAALTDVNVNELTDPSFLEAIVPSALKLVLADGEHKVQDLKLAGGRF